MSTATKMLESEVIRQVSDFLTFEGWRAVKHEYLFTGTKVVGEKGMPDWSYTHYLKGDGVTCTLWIEFKSPSDRRKCRCEAKNAGKKRFTPCTPCAQAAWKKAEEDRGAIVLRVNNFEAFRAWYTERYHWVRPYKRGQQILTEAS
jgi:hypothetical protein